MQKFLYLISWDLVNLTQPRWPSPFGADENPHSSYCSRWCFNARVEHKLFQPYYRNVCTTKKAFLLRRITIAFIRFLFVDKPVQPWNKRINHYTVLAQPQPYPPTSNINVISFWCVELYTCASKAVRIKGLLRFTTVLKFRVNVLLASKRRI